MQALWQNGNRSNRIEIIDIINHFFSLGLSSIVTKFFCFSMLGFVTLEVDYKFLKKIGEFQSRTFLPLNINGFSMFHRERLIYKIRTTVP
jgi:hypothetical protein